MCVVFKVDLVGILSCWSWRNYSFGCASPRSGVGAGAGAVCAGQSSTRLPGLNLLERSFSLKLELTTWARLDDQ